MPEGPFGGPRLTSIGPFTEDETVIEFVDARRPRSPEEKYEIQERVRDAIDDVSYIDPPSSDLTIEDKEIAGVTETVATVRVYKEFITLEQLDAIRDVIEDSLDTEGGQIKG